MINKKCACVGWAPPVGGMVGTYYQAFELDEYECVHADFADNPSFLMSHAQTNCPGACSL
jgi:hypothetical protein